MLFRYHRITVVRVVVKEGMAHRGLPVPSTIVQIALIARIKAKRPSLAETRLRKKAGCIQMCIQKEKNTNRQKQGWFGGLLSILQAQ